MLTHYNLAYAYEKKDMIDEAILEYKNAIDVNLRRHGKSNAETVQTQKEEEDVIVTSEKHEN